ncbi:MAG: class I SAM-dependent methyltransferase [Chloroflexi bacterium]|nr:class I SAM-dependent methyltransferase [Chloroflexota bacterium]
MEQNLSIARGVRRPGPSRPPDESYRDVRVAAVYAALHGPGPDTDHYRRLARPGPLDVLDVGCGSGRLGVLLAQDGHRVVGIDPSAAMVAHARRSDRTGSASWVVGDARDLRLGRTFDLVAMTGHAFQVLLDDSDTAAFLTGAHAHLRPGGTLAFETRNPVVRAWTEWTPARSRRVAQVDGLGRVEVHNDVVEVVDELVTYRTVYRFDDGDEIVTSSTLRFPAETTVAAALREAGFAPVGVHGGWDGSAVTPASRELVVVAVRPREPDLQ